MESLVQLQRRVGRNLRAIRAVRGLTQAQLAEAIGVDERYYQRVESGTQPLTLRTLHRFAATLKISVAELLAQDGAPAGGGAGRPKKRPRG